jgi:hypothetical protein
MNIGENSAREAFKNFINPGVKPFMGLHLPSNIRFGWK